MNGYYLGNGNKRPKLADYKKNLDGMVECITSVIN